MDLGRKTNKVLILLRSRIHPWNCGNPAAGSRQAHHLFAECEARAHPAGLASL